jgi:P-type Mg2+ transporter
VSTSANLGNMVSMAAASLVLPFLPLTAGQILLNNFLSDIPAIGVASDTVDRELVESPTRWDMGFIGRYMVEFGAVSSVFDLLTFARWCGYFTPRRNSFAPAGSSSRCSPSWSSRWSFVTRRPFYRSRPGRVLLVSTLALIALTLAIPFLPGAAVLGFVPLPGAIVEEEQLRPGRASLDAPPDRSA